MSFGGIILYGSIFSPVIPIMAATLRRKALDRTSLLILYLVLLSFTIDLVMMWVAMQKKTNIPLAHFYGLLEGALLIGFFGLLTGRKKLTQMLLPGYVILYVANSAFVESIYVFNAWSRSAEALLMMVLSVFAFHQFYTKEEDIFIEKSPQFWFVIGIFAYFSGALFSFLLSTDMLTQSPDVFYGSWVLHNLCNILKNVVFALGLWKLKS